MQANPIPGSNPDASPPFPGLPLFTENFWIRTWKADCFSFQNPTGTTPGSASLGYEKTGILRYGSSQALPMTNAWPKIALLCSDETNTSLEPIVPWTVGNPANAPSGNIGEELVVQLQPGTGIYPLAAFSMGGQAFNPLQIDYTNPIFMNLNHTGQWPPPWVVFPENYKDTNWVRIVSCSRQLVRKLLRKTYNPSQSLLILTKADGVVGVHGSERKCPWWTSRLRWDFWCTSGKENSSGKWGLMTANQSLDPLAWT